MGKFQALVVLGRAAYSSAESYFARIVAEMNLEHGTPVAPVAFLIAPSMKSVDSIARKVYVTLIHACVRAVTVYNECGGGDGGRYLSVV